jgi:hypothetical protein
MAPVPTETPFNVVTWLTNNWTVLTGTIMGMYYAVKLVWNFASYARGIEDKFVKIEGTLRELKTDVKHCLSCQNRIQEQKSSHQSDLY